MDRYAGPARSEWEFASPLENEEREGWSFLMALDPYFALRLLDR